MKINKILLVILLTSASCSLDAQNTMVMTVEGTKQGLFKTDSSPDSKLGGNKTELFGYSYEVNSPRSAGTGGMATGKIVHQPVIVWKKNGESSPQFLQAATTSELLTKITIEYYTQDPTGKQVLSYTIVLENASVTSIRQFMGPLNDRFQESAISTLYDEIGFIFGKITVTEAKGKTTVTDNVYGGIR